MADTIQFNDLNDPNNPLSQQQGQQGQQSTYDQNNNNQGQSGASQTQSNQPQGGGSGSQSLDQYKPAAYNQQKQGTGYTNIGRIVQANKSNQLGQAVGSNIQQAGQQTQANIQQAGQQFGQQAQANQADTAQNQQLIQDVLANPAAYAGATDQNNAQSNQGTLFTQLMSGKYAGPTQLQNDAQLQAQVQGTQQLGQALGSSSGQIGLLQRLVGGQGAGYTSGQQNLDQLLLGQTGGNAIGQARRSVLGLGNQLGTVETGAQATGQEQAAKAQQLGQNIQQQVGQNISAQDTALQAQATQAQTAKDAAYQKMITDLQSGKITQQEADMLGLKQGQQLYGTLANASPFLAEDPTKASAQNVASSNDYAKMDALRKLGGQYNPADASAILQKYADQNTQASAFQAGPTATPDKTAFQKALTASSSEYNSKLKPATDALGNAQTIYNWQNGIIDPKDFQPAIQALEAEGGHSTATSYAQLTPADKQYLGQVMLRKNFPSALGGDANQNRNWASNNLATQQQNLKNTQALLNAAYKGPKQVTILPEQGNRAKMAVGPTLANILNDNTNAFNVK